MSERTTTNVPTAAEERELVKSDPLYLKAAEDCPRMQTTRLLRMYFDGPIEYVREIELRPRTVTYTTLVRAITELVGGILDSRILPVYSPQPARSLLEINNDPNEPRCPESSFGRYACGIRKEPCASCPKAAKPTYSVAELTDALNHAEKAAKNDCLGDVSRALDLEEPVTWDQIVAKVAYKRTAVEALESMIENLCDRVGLVSSPGMPSFARGVGYSTALDMIHEMVAKPAPQTNVGWLIQTDKIGGMNYWKWHNASDHGSTWTTDSACATRFARKQDAESIQNTLSLRETKVAEHSWSASAETASAAYLKPEDSGFDEQQARGDGAPTYSPAGLEWVRDGRAEVYRVPYTSSTYRLRRKQAPVEIDQIARYFEGEGTDEQWGVEYRAFAKIAARAIRARKWQ